MHRLSYTSKYLIALCCFAIACREASGPIRPRPASLEVVASPASSAQIGRDAGAFTVRVADENGISLSGVVVMFTVSSGGARVSRKTDTTVSDGTASTMLTLGTIPGANEVTAAVKGLTPVKAATTALAGPVRTIAPSPRVLRFSTALSTSIVSATPRDEFGNASNTPVTWTSRDPALLSATPLTSTTARLSVVSRPGQTYVVVQSGTAADSLLVSVQDASSTPCTYVVTPTTLAVGGSMTFDDGLACVHSTDVGAEYLVTAHYNTAVAFVSARVEMTASGIVAPASSFPSVVASTRLISLDDTPRPDLDFERSLRSREQREISAYVPGARAWFKASRAATVRSAMPALRANLRDGDVVSLNVNANDFCSNPEVREARVVAMTNTAVVMADLANPVDGFTDAEYRSYGVEMDTLVNPLDTAAFGAPSDIDGNHRVGILFTSAVNELTSALAGRVVQGFYYARDLLPKESSTGDCPGSNASEMFYMMVPDPNGTINSNKRTKDYVDRIVVATIAHEYQHLINASRRMYVNDAPQVDEEVWLNEGLSHIAEELVFYRVSGLAPRQNIDGSNLGLNSPLRDVFDRYQRNNLGRYREFLLVPQSNGPIAHNDLLATRGATWSFLRYLADRTRTSDGDFWRRLVNSKLTGVPNLDDVLSGTGLTTLSALRDWSAAVAVDDLAPNIISAFQQPSWNFLSALPAVGLGTPYPFVPRSLTDATTTAVVLGGATSQYGRFGVGQDREALIQISGPNGTPLPSGVRFTLVRIK